MVKCGCASDRCTCTIIAGDGVDLAGTGSPSNPYVITAIPTESAGTGDASGRFSGEITMYGGAVAPSGWLICNGAAISRTVYAALYTAIGIAYGAGDGSTTFNLPDLTDSLPMGAGGAHARGSSAGSNTLTPGNLPIHNHAIDHTHATASTTSAGLHDHPTYHREAAGSSTFTFQPADPTGRAQDSNLVGSAGSHSHSVSMPPYTGTSGDAGSATPDPFEPPNTAVTFIIKV